MANNREIIGQGIASFSTGVANELMRQADQNKLATLMQSGGGMQQAIQAGIPIETAIQIAKMQELQKEAKRKDEQQKMIRQKFFSDDENSSQKTDAAKLNKSVGKEDFIARPKMDSDGNISLDFVPIDDTNEGKLKLEEEKLKLKQQYGADWEKIKISNEETAKLNKLKSENIIDSTNSMLNTIKEVEDGMNFFGALGPLPTLNPWNYKRKDWEANVNKLLAKKVVDLIGEMKNASKTGATGFGQLSEREGQLLQDASTALNRGLSPEDAQKYLDEMKPILAKVLARESNNESTSDNDPLGLFS